MNDLQIEQIDPIELKPHPKNAKVHTDKQIDRIAKSMGNTNGSIQPIVVDEDRVILAGHGRWMAHKKLGDTSCPVIVKSGLTSAQKLKFLLADNQTNAMTGNDFESVVSILTTLDSEGVEVSDIGFSEKELDKFLNYDGESDEDKDTMADASADSPTLRELKEDMPLHRDQCVGAFELPKLLAHKIPAFGQYEFVVWMNRHRTPPLADKQMHYHLFGRESTKGLDPFNALISFYIDDVRFERTWTKLKENTQRLINADVRALVMPDFTRVDGWPHAKNLWNTYRNFYCALYWQEAGLDVIPNLTDWSLDSVEPCCAPIPVGCPTVSTQIQTVGGRTMKSGDGAQGQDADTFRECLGVSLDLIKPETMMVYGGERGLTLGEEICKRHNVRFVGVLNRATAATGLNSERGI